MDPHDALSMTRRVQSWEDKKINDATRLHNMASSLKNDAVERIYKCWLDAASIQASNGSFSHAITLTSDDSKFASDVLSKMKLNGFKASISDHGNTGRIVLKGEF